MRSLVMSCILQVPTRMLSELQPDEPPSSTIPTYSTNGATIAEAEEKDLRDGVEDQNDLGQMWTRAWVCVTSIVRNGRMLLFVVLPLSRPPIYFHV